MGLGAQWCPLGQLLSTIPYKGTVFCDVVYQWFLRFHCVLLILQLINLTITTMNFWNVLEANQCIDNDRWNHKKWHPCHDLPQTCRGRKYICPVWIRPTEDFLTHLRKNFRVNKLWYNKYDTHKSTINKRRLEQRTWRRF